MTTLLDIGAALKSFRKKQGLTVSALAERSNIHRNTLSALEHGVGNVELNTLLAVCEQLGLDLVPTPARIATLFRDRSIPPYDPPPAPESTSAKQAPRMRTATGLTGNFDEPSALQKRIAERLASTAKHKNKDRK